MRLILILFITLSNLFATEIELKNGDLIEGNIIYQNRGKVVIKDGSSIVSIYKKSIKRYDSTNVEGTRKLLFPDSMIVKDKNEVIIINNSSDTATVKLRKSASKDVVAQDTLTQADTTVFMVSDGSYYETVKFKNGNKEYYTKGRSFEISSKENSFSKVELELKGYSDENYPKLKGPKMEYYK